MASIASRSTTTPSASASSAVPSVSTIPAPVQLMQEDEDTPIVRFTNVQDLFDAIDCVIGDFLTVTDVSALQLTEIEHEREKQHRKFRFRRYHSTSGILIITIPTGLHEHLHTLLYERYRDQIVLDGRSESWESMASTTLRRQGHPQGDIGEGDSTGGPLPEREGIGKWPTLVIEAGYSESLGELHNDMRWWFQTSDHDVKIVILVKFDRQQQHVLLEKWEEEISLPQGAITRGRAVPILQQNGVLEPVQRQSITITRDDTTNPVSYNVTRGPLVLGFRLLFLRNPGPQEGDISISIPSLQRYAQRVWTQVPH